MQRRNLMWLGVCLTLLLGGLAQATSKGEPVEAPTRIRGLLAALDDPDPEVVAKALEWLTEKELAEPGVRERLQAFTREPRMLELLRAKDGRTQLAAINALGPLGWEAAQAHTAFLVDCLRSQDVRQEAVVALVKMGASASAQAPLVANLLQDKDEVVRRTALDALRHNMGGRLVRRLHSLLTSCRTKMRASVEQRWRCWVIWEGRPARRRHWLPTSCRTGTRWSVG